MPRKAPYQHATRIKNFEKELKSLLQAKMFLTREELFKSKDFKKMTVPKSRRGQKAVEPLFFRTMKERCCRQVESEAYKMCSKLATSKINREVKKGKLKPREDLLVNTTDETPVAPAMPCLDSTVKTESEDGKFPGALMGIENFNQTVCYAISALQLLLTVEPMYEDLSQLHARLTEGVPRAFFLFLEAKRAGNKDDTNVSFLNLLTSLGTVRPAWEDLSQTQDSEEYLGALLSQIQSEMRASHLPDVLSNYFSCQSVCNGCGLEQSAEGFIKYCSLVMNEDKTACELVQEVLEQHMDECVLKHSSPCRATSIPSFLLVKINRYNLMGEVLKKATLRIEQEEHFQTGELVGKYQLKGAIIYHRFDDSVDHYTCVSWHSETHSWYKFDDENCTKMTQESAIRLIQNKASVLLFELRSEEQIPD